MNEELDTRLQAICELSLPYVRDSAGRHEYDGRVQDLSPAGVRSALAGLTADLGYVDRHDEAHAAATENALRVRFGELELHRVNPLWHLDNLELMVYERPYAPAEERAEARRRHLAAWPDAVDAAVEALDRVPRELASASVPLARGLATYAGRDAAAGAALKRLVDHLDWASIQGDSSAALGRSALERLLSASEAIDVDLADLLARAEKEQARLRQLLDDACRRIDPDATTGETLRVLRTDHPATGAELLDETRLLVDEVLEWTARSGLVPVDDGVCEVGPMPDSQRRGLAGLFAAAPYEPDGPSAFYVTLPDPSWAESEQRAWLASGFNRSQLPGVAVHEVAPGHFSHFRALRQLPSPVRRLLTSDAFIEGWAHYVEELCVEEGYRADDPRFTAGVARDGLLRVTRLICSIGLHTGDLTVAEAARRFTEDAFVVGPGAVSEAQRGLFDPTYGRYTWGKLEILGLRDRARAAWGVGFSLPRFHAALFALGAPPMGLIDTALTEG
ncbi:DUF885 family protein [Nocardioides speluncae]|uniref:DUF885 family protein n=1 Tax=Nocardioides speluncae TaxID=2670337 RepID=UPI000D6A01DA|nr:DUF885 family protein [Nocardioides speluncae]